MKIGSARNVAASVACLLLTACSLLVGIDPDLGVRASADGGAADAPAEASSPFWDAVAADVPPAKTPVWPKEGVYQFKQADLKPGSDRILGSTQTYTNGTVTVHWLNATCFELTLSPRNGFTDMMRFCIQNTDTLVQQSGERKQTLNVFGTQNVETFQVCSPGDPYFSYTLPADGGWPHDCIGQNRDTKTGDSGFRTTGAYVHVADETLTVMGRQVPTRHFRSRLTITGAQTGTNDNEWWFSLEDAMLVRWLRDIEIDYNAPIIGTVTYTEHEDMTLVAVP